MLNRLIRMLKQSLQVRISIALILMFLPLAMAAGVFSYYDTFHEAEELQDDLLRQTALYVGPDYHPMLCRRGTTIRVFWYRCRIRSRLSVCRYI